MTLSRAPLILILSSHVLLAPPPLAAQPAARMSHVGVLVYGTQPDPYVEIFRNRMRELGHVEGQNLALESRYAEGKVDRLPTLAAELVRLKVDLIFTVGTDVAAFARRAMATIPIVMVASGDAARAGLAATLARPGGNVTGVTLLASELAGERLELLREAAPRVSRVAVLWNPDHPDEEFGEMQEKARLLGMQLQSLATSSAPSVSPPADEPMPSSRCRVGRPFSTGARSPASRSSIACRRFPAGLSSPKLAGC